MKASQITGFLKVVSVSYMGYLAFWAKEELDFAAALCLCLWMSNVAASVVLTFVFRSSIFEKDMPVAEIILGIPFFFGVYWAIPYFIMTHQHQVPPDPLSALRILVSAVLFNVGLATIICTEAQTYYMMMYEPQALLQSTAPKQLVQPYLVGEFILYLSFALLTRAYEAYVILALMFLIVFIPHNLLKEAQIIQHVEAYRAYGILSPLVLLLSSEHFSLSDRKNLLNPLPEIAEETVSEMKADTAGNIETLQRGANKRRPAKMG